MYCSVLPYWDGCAGGSVRMSMALFLVDYGWICSGNGLRANVS